MEVKRGGGFITRTKRYLTKHVSRKAVTLSEELIPRNGKLKRIRAKQNLPSSTSASLHFCLILSFCRWIFLATPLSWCRMTVLYLHIAEVVILRGSQAVRPQGKLHVPQRKDNCSGFPQTSTLCPISCQLEGRVGKNKYGLQGLTSPETVDSGVDRGGVEELS